MSTTPILSQQRIAVADEGSLVHITVGNYTLTMPYDGALQLSQLIRVHAKRAKRTAGDVSRHWSAVALVDGVPN